jgi:hypothetical protein
MILSRWDLVPASKNGYCGSTPRSLAESETGRSWKRASSTSKTRPCRFLICRVRQTPQPHEGSEQQHLIEQLDGSAVKEVQADAPPAPWVLQVFREVRPQPRSPLQILGPEELAAVSHQAVHRPRKHCGLQRGGLITDAADHPSLWWLAGSRERVVAVSSRTGRPSALGVAHRRAWRRQLRGREALRTTAFVTVGRAEREARAAGGGRAGRATPATGGGRACRPGSTHAVRSLALLLARREVDAPAHPIALADGGLLARLRGSLAVGALQALPAQRTAEISHARACDESTGLALLPS